jgi:hypothetical protein
VRHPDEDDGSTLDSTRAGEVGEFHGLDAVASARAPADFGEGVHQSSVGDQQLRVANGLIELVGLGRVELPTSPLSVVNGHAVSYGLARYDQLQHIAANRYLRGL